MEEKGKRQRRPKEGDVFAIPLGDGTYGFCQVCRSKSYAYFDLRLDKIPNIETVISSPVVFRVAMVQDAAKEGGWLLIGNADLHGDLSQPATFWTQSVGSNDVQILRDNVFTPATRGDIEGLELMAWWYEHHVVTRLLDHFNGPDYVPSSARDGSRDEPLPLVD